MNLKKRVSVPKNVFGELIGNFVSYSTTRLTKNRIFRESIGIAPVVYEASESTLSETNFRIWFLARDTFLVSAAEYYYRTQKAS